MISYKEKLEQITTFIFDIDGVFTDGTFSVIDGEYIRTFHTKDTYALRRLSSFGYAIFIISRTRNMALIDVFKDFGCTEVILASKDKGEDFEELRKKYQFLPEQCLYMGDDYPDLSILKRVGISTCPADAAVEIRKICDYQSPYLGGKGAVRDVIEQALRVHNQWYSEE